MNSTRVTRALGIDVFDLTRAEAISHRQARQIAEFLRSRVPGFAEAYLAQTGVGVGVRETRRVLGEYVLTGEDVLTPATFDDVIACGTYPIDIHNPTGRGTTLRDLPPGAAYEIPLRCLLPRGVDRLLVAGRCISGTYEAHSSYRVTPTAVATGHAAGVTAALAATARQLLPRQVPIADVQAELQRQGADLHHGARRLTGAGAGACAAAVPGSGWRMETAAWGRWKRLGRAPVELSGVARPTPVERSQADDLQSGPGRATVP